MGTDVLSHLLLDSRTTHVVHAFYSDPLTVVLMDIADIHHIIWTAQAMNTEGTNASQARHMEPFAATSEPANRNASSM